MPLSPSHCITLTTDFGTSDWFVGTMKGVILSLAPRATIVDLTHEIPAGNIRAGAFSLAASFSFFPRGTIHVVVVDPGVGTSRVAIAVRTSHYLFVAPDNGLVSLAAAKDGVKAVHRLENHAYFLPSISATFHGRDVFAPIAAHLTKKLPLSRFGPSQKDFVRLEWPQPKGNGSFIAGEVLYIDRFGNAITNISSPLLNPQTTDATIFLRDRRICPVAPFYQAVAPGQPVGVLGSTGFLELAINEGNAAKRLNLQIGDRIKVLKTPKATRSRRSIQSRG